MKQLNPQIPCQTIQLTEGMYCDRICLLFPGKRSRGNFQRIEQKAFVCYSILHRSKNLYCVTKSMEIISSVRISFVCMCTQCVSILTSDSVAKKGDAEHCLEVTTYRLWLFPRLIIEKQDTLSSVSWPDFSHPSHGSTEPDPLRAVALTDFCSMKFLWGYF